MRKAEATNSFNEGMIMDLNPLVTPNNVLTNCLNGTLITMNGLENCLLNDMGNGRVETAYLPEGYIPLGTAELGGIIYIVSYNPLRDTCLIGSFPSPERNITSDELGTNLSLDCNKFYSSTVTINAGKENAITCKFISNPNLKLILTPDTTLNPGDKFLITSADLNNNYDVEGELTTTPGLSLISAVNQTDSNPDLWPKYLKFNIVAITDDGKMTNLNKTLTWLPITVTTEKGTSEEQKYYIKNDKISDSEDTNIDEYRNLIQSNYHVFQSKTSGKIALLAELECIDTFDIAWDAKKNSNNKWEFYLYTNWTYENDYAKDKINLSGIYYTCKITPTTESSTESTTESSTEPSIGLIEINDYPYKDSSNKVKSASTNICSHDVDDVFLNPVYLNNLDNIYTDKEKTTTTQVATASETRNNDGTDNQFLITSPITVDQTSGKLSLDIMPTMPFGILEWMKLTINIDLDKLGTGAIDLILYKYYVEDEIILLNWGLEAYPERNKSIKGVTIRICEITSYLLNKINKTITNYENWFDDGRAVKTSGSINTSWQIYQNNVWENLPDDLLDYPNITISDTDIKKEIPVNQSSYSGYFTNIIDRSDLLENYVYLVEFDIDYNGEKNYKYYRILYNAPIFNSEYYNDAYPDFKKLVLSKYLTFTGSITNKPMITNELVFEKEAPPQIVDTSTSTQTQYNLINTYSGTDTATLNVDAGNVFEVNVKSSSIKNVEDPTYSDDSEATQVSTSNLLSSINLDKITTELQNTFTITGTTISVNPLNYKLTIPLTIKYENAVALNVSYALEHITFTAKWLTYRGREKGHMIGIYTDINSIGSVGAYDVRDNWGDDTLPNGSFETLTNNCYKHVSNLLDSYDVVFLPMFTCRALSGDCGKKYKNAHPDLWYNGARVNRTDAESYSDGDLGTHKCILLYAMKTQDGEVVLFVPNKPNGVPSLYGMEASGFYIPLYEAENAMLATILNIKVNIDHFNTTSTSDYIPAFADPLRGYYVPKEYSGTITKYSYSQIQYYPSFTATVKLTLPIRLDEYNLIFNNELTLNHGSNIKNLQIDETKELEVDYINSWDINTTDNITYLMQAASNVYIKMPDGKFKDTITVSKSKVYNKEGSPISRMAVWNGTSGEPPILTNDSVLAQGLTFCVSDERMRIKSIQSAKRSQLKGYSEELNATLTNIPVIT